MECFVKETLYVLDYKDNIKDAIFISDDHRTPGYALNIRITEANTGYSDLTFDMPNTIINDLGEKELNPKLALLTPLVKLRYHRQVLYTGEEDITVREPAGYGDKVEYIDKTYTKEYPNNLMEDYIMDYIVQPVDRERDTLVITTSFTAIDYPRFNLSKKKLGLTIGNDTLTKPEWSLYKNSPLDVAGKVKYEKWDSRFAEYSTVTEWDPENAKEYPLNRDAIIEMLNDVGIFSYGILTTVFYWPIVSTARFKGTLYKKGGYLAFNLYDLYQTSTLGIEQKDRDYYVGRYSWEWSQIAEVQPLLTPNRADNYLRYILEGTNWSIKKRPDGTDDVDIEIVQVPTPVGAYNEYEDREKAVNISLNQSNCYNAITAVCQGLQLYPIYDCVNREVSLRIFSGKNYGLTYRLGSNIKDDSVHLDGEKVITKLHVFGGKDYSGTAEIALGSVRRSYEKKLTGFYRSVAELPTTDVEGKWAIVDTDIPADNFKLNTLDNEGKETIITVHDYLVKDYWITGNRKIYQYSDGNWSECPKTSQGEYYYIDSNGDTHIIDYTTGMDLGDGQNWDPNADEYIMGRSPYGTEYILNFKWMYDNNWITKEEILKIYQYNMMINEVNINFFDKYNEDLKETSVDYYNAVAQYGVDQDMYQSVLNNMMAKYFYDEDDYSKGSFYAFHRCPQDTYVNVLDGKHYVKLYYCHNCGQTSGVKPNGSKAGADIKVCPNCGNSDVENEEIYLPVWDDFEQQDAEERLYPYAKIEYPRYTPRIKGTYLRLVTTLDDENSAWDYEDYEQKISILEPIELRTGGPDGREYVISDVFVKASSGQIENWNEAIADFIKYHGASVRDLRVLNYTQAKLEELEQREKRWNDYCNSIQAKIQEEFGDYIVEGNYKNTDQVDPKLLFNEGLEASDKYCIPDVTYDLDVIASSGLIEYRGRNGQGRKYTCLNCGRVSYTKTDICVVCGEHNIEKEPDIYNDLVRMLHSVGQIVPKAGDYAIVYDEPMGFYGVPGLITQVERILDEPYQNSLTLDTSYTKDDEELVGNIITATNTVLNNSDIYARTAVLRSDGTIDTNTIRNSLDTASGNITLVGTDGTMLLNSSGLKFVDSTDPTKAMKYTGSGVLATSTHSENGEGTIWNKLMTPDGINANYISAGTIDTNKVNIISGGYGKVSLDDHGLVVRQNAGKTYRISGFNPSSDSSIAWGSNNNIAAFVGVDNENNPLVYVNGRLVATQGSNIANWITDDTGFYHKASNGNKDIWMSPSGISGSVNSTTGNFAFFANGNFGVTTNGTLYANGANIKGSGEFSGKITCNSDSSINGSLGKVEATSVTLSANGVDGTVNNHSDKWAIYSKGNFGVTTAGNLWATGAHIKGDIYAESGTFNGTVYASSGTFNGAVYASSGSFSGAVYASSGSFNGSITAGSGSIGGWTINGSSISGGGTTLYSNGTINTNSLNMSGGTIGKWTIDADGLKYKTSSGQVTALTPDGYNYFSGSANPESVTIGTSLEAYVWSADITAKSDVTLAAGVGTTYGTGDVLLSGENIKFSSSKIQVKNGSTYYSGVTGYVKFSWNGIGDSHNDYMAFVNGILVYAGTNESTAQTRSGKTTPLFEY